MKSKSITTLMIKWIASNLSPYYVVDTRLFKEMANEICMKNYDIPSQYIY